MGAPSNARVAGRPFLISKTAICPAASSPSTQVRAAAWKATAAGGTAEHLPLPPIAAGLERPVAPRAASLWFRARRGFGRLGGVVCGLWRRHRPLLERESA